MRERPNVLLNLIHSDRRTTQCVALSAVSAILLFAMPGCSDSAASDGYQNYAEVPTVASPDDDLPVVTPGTTPENTDAPETGASSTDAVSKQSTSDGAPVETVSITKDKPVAGSEPTDATAQPELKETGTRDEVVLAARNIELLIPDKSFSKDRKTKALRVTYDDIDLLKILNMEPVPTDAADHFPAWLKQLDGARIRIRGFMYPPYQSTGLKGFSLARDNGICCFVRQAKIYDLFLVKLAEGETTDYIQNRPFDVVGTFHIDPLVEDDELLQLYRIDEARVIDR